jgi:hypothetical protein
MSDASPTHILVPHAPMYNDVHASTVAKLTKLKHFLDLAARQGLRDLAMDVTHVTARTFYKTSAEKIISTYSDRSITGTVRRPRL